MFLICFSFWHSVEISWDWGVAICTGDLYPASQRISCKAAVALVNWTRNARTFVPQRVRLSQPRVKKADKRKTQSLKQLYNTIVWDIASEKLKIFTSCWRDGDWVPLQIILRAMEQCVRVWDNKQLNYAPLIPFSMVESMSYLSFLKWMTMTWKWVANKASLLS